VLISDALLLVEIIYQKILSPLCPYFSLRSSTDILSSLSCNVCDICLIISHLIGSSIELSKRIDRHFRELSECKHHNSYLNEVVKMLFGVPRLDMFAINYY